MSTTYTYSLSTDFSGGLNNNQFAEEIKNDVTITTTLSHVTTNDDVVDIVFVSSLSGAEVTALNSLIASYVYAADPKIEFSSAGGSYGSVATISVAPTSNKTITIPDLTDTIACLVGEQTLISKKLEDSSTSFVDNGDDTKTLSFSLSGATTGSKLTLISNHSTDRSITFPDTTATLSVDGHVHAAGDVTSGTFADARIAQSNVTQHESAITHQNLSGAGTNTHAQIDSHIADATLHRAINDGATGATDLFSASKIITELGTKSNTGHTHVASNITDFNSATDARISLQKAAANGLATLDGTGKVPSSQLSLSNVLYVGTWNATTNTPTLTNGTGTQGNYYVVSAAGSTSLDGITDWKVGDWAIFNGTVWEKSDHTDSVTSVAGKQGAVTLQRTDITDLADTGDLPEGSNLYYTDARVNSNSVVAANTAKVSADGSIETHSNVVVTSVVDNEVLAYNSANSRWINQTATEAGLAEASHTHNASDINAGTLADARVAQSNVTQHESAITHQNLSGAGTNTHTQIDTHIADDTKHRVISDGATGATDLWSAGKIITELSGKSDTGHTHVSANITDLSTSTVPEGTNLYYTEARVNGNSNVTTNTAKVSADGSVATHADVVITGVTDNEVLAYDTGTSKWINQTPAEAGLAAVSHTHAASDVTSGTFADTRISETCVTQHTSAIVHQNLSGVGTNTHAQIDTHLADNTKHRLINDAGTAATELWSANKISSDLSGKVATSVQVNSGVGLSGGGDLTANRTIDLDINSLTVDGAPDTTSDYVVSYDMSAGTAKRVLMSNLSSGGGGPGNGGNQHACQIRKTTTYSMSSATYTSVSFDTTDFETNASVIEHDNVDDTKITVKEDGPYLIYFHAVMDFNTSDVVSARVLVNGTTEIPGSFQKTSTKTNNSFGDLDNTFTCVCLANDYIQLQVRAESGSFNSQPHLTYGVVRLSGSRGIEWESGGWVTTTSYTVTQSLLHNGNAYYCKSDHTATSTNEPGVGASWADFWDVLVDSSIHTHATSDITSGTFADARIAQSNVTQHESAITHQNLSGSGTNTHAQIDTHIADDSKHRIINDSGTLVTELFSASKIISELSGKSDTGHTHATSDVTSGTFADARIAQSNVTQHESAITHQNLSGSGTNTHAQIDTHIADATLHRVINDGATGATELFSASKIITELSGKSDTGHAHVASNITDFNSATDARISLQKAAANGLATLDGGGKVPSSQLSLSNVLYVGTWNANTNTPTLTNGTGTQGNYYVVSITGSTSLDGITDWNVGDWAIFNGTVWEKSDHTDAVTSVAGKQGAVTLQLADITDLADTGDLPEGSNLYYTEARVNANTNVTANTAKVSAGGSVSTHSDVVVTSVTDNEVLAYDNATSKWINQTPAEAGLAAVSHTHATSDITSGTFADARIAQSNVTQHEGAITHQNLSGSGTNTHAQIDTHIADDTKHRVISDGATGATDLWSAGKIITELSGKSGTGHTHATSDVTSGTFADARIAQSNVTQHEGAITIGNLSGAPASAIVGITDAQTLTNKVLDSTTNTITTDNLRSATTKIDVKSATAPTSGQVLTATSGTAATWQNIPAGVFGSEFKQSSSDPESTTTATTLQDKTTLTTPSLPSGTYRLGYSYELSNASNGVLSEVEVKLDGAVVSLTTFEADNDFHSLGGFVYQSLSGVVTATIKHRVQTTGTCKIRRARLELWRVS